MLTSRRLTPLVGAGLLVAALTGCALPLPGMGPAPAATSEGAAPPEALGTEVPAPDQPFTVAVDGVLLDPAETMCEIIDLPDRDPLYTFAPDFSASFEDVGDGFQVLTATYSRDDRGYVYTEDDLFATVEGERVSFEFVMADEFGEVSVSVVGDGLCRVQ